MERLEGPDMHATRSIGVLTLAMALAALGCDDGKNNNNDQDTGTDTETDSTADTIADSTDDPSTDTSGDPTTDPSTDEETDDGVEPVYPTAVGDWEAFIYDQEDGDLVMHLEMTLTDSTLVQRMYEPTGPTTEDLMLGMRADYTVTGETVMYSLTEGTLDGTTWFTETSDATAWADFVTNQMGGLETWSSILAVSISGEHMFSWTDDFGDAPTVVVWPRTAGTAVPAVGYPSYEGDWQTVIYELGTTNPQMRIDVTVEATSLQTDMFEYTTAWTYYLGIRADYVLDGDENNQTVTEFTIDGISWITETSNPSAWDDFITTNLGGHETSSSLWGVSPTGEHMFAASDVWSGVLQTFMYSAI